MNGTYHGPESIYIGRPSHLSEDDARAMVRERMGKEEITDACAVTIASWFAGHRYGDGLAMAELSTSGKVHLQDLGDDLSSLFDELERYSPDYNAVCMLATWALNHGSRAARHVDYPHQDGALYDCKACEYGPNWPED